MQGSAAFLTVLLCASALAEDPPRLACELNDPQPPSRVDTTERLNQLKTLLTTNNIAAYIVLTNDDHQSEYVAPPDARRQYISGFSGSSGWAVITPTQALLWTDSRYYLQADQQLDCNWILQRDGTPGVPSTEQWIVENLKENDVVSVDSKTVPSTQWNNWEKIFKTKGIVLRDATPNRNLVDEVWGDERPEYSNEGVMVLADKYTGETWQAKVTRLGQKLKDLGVHGTVVSALDEVAWLLNVRGTDIPYTPVVRSYVILKWRDDQQTALDLTLFVNQTKITENVQEHLKVGQLQEGVQAQVKNYEDVWADLTDFAAVTTNKVLLPSRFSYNLGTSRAVHEKFTAADQVIEAPSPLSVMKDVKNEVEAKGMRDANLRDSAALIKFLAELEAGVLKGEDWDEIKATKRVEAIRAEIPLNHGASFESVSASGINSALPHYEATAVTNSKINQSAVYTLDSGGHYLDGTTDVTRTIFIGTPAAIHKEVYTRLLSGCINLASTIFPMGANQAALDIMVRGPLYSAGLDFGHGTGHGIGHFGNVHEAFNTTFNINYFGSQEPGFYQAGDFGMRLENIVTVLRKQFDSPYAVDKTFLQFDPVTLVPYEANMIDVALLTEKQVIWLNDYHARVKKEVTPYLGNDVVALEWLDARTQPYKAPCNEGSINKFPTSFAIISVVIAYWVN